MTGRIVSRKLFALKVARFGQQEPWRVDDVMFCRLDAQDVVRNRLVSRIVEAYAAFDALTSPTKPSTKR